MMRRCRRQCHAVRQTTTLNWRPTERASVASKAASGPQLDHGPRCERNSEATHDSRRRNMD
eukprot:4620781-Pyramimonas_sp.AAC.1